MSNQEITNTVEQTGDQTPKQNSASKAFFIKIGNSKFIQFFVKQWKIFKKKYPNIAQFLVFFMVSNGVTVLQMAMMAILRPILSNTSLIDVSFQWIQVGHTLNGDLYYAFNYPAGIGADAGGLAYFLSYTFTIAIAQVINFFAQKNITFKSNTNPWISAMWYAIAFVAIIFVAAIAQGFYRAPIYNWLEGWMGHDTGYATADILTMIINSAISFWVFFPIFKIIFKQKKEDQVYEQQN